MMNERHCFCLHEDNQLILLEVRCDMLPLGSVHEIQFHSNVKLMYE